MVEVKVGKTGDELAARKAAERALPKVGESVVQ